MPHDGGSAENEIAAPAAASFARCPRDVRCVLKVATVGASTLRQAKRCRCSDALSAYSRCLKSSCKFSRRTRRVGCIVPGKRTDWTGQFDENEYVIMARYPYNRLYYRSGSRSKPRRNISGRESVPLSSALPFPSRVSSISATRDLRVARKRPEWPPRPLPSDDLPVTAWAIA